MAKGSENLIACFRSAPSAATAPPSSSLSFTMRPVPPFRLDLTAWALRRRPENILDRWDGQVYRRALALDGKIGGEIVEVAVEQTGSAAHPRLTVTAHADRHAPDAESLLRSTLERMLGLKIDLRDFYSFAAKQKTMRSLIVAFAGFKPPRYPTIFEALLNAISCQQVSLDVGIMLLNRLIETFGRSPLGNTSTHACPSPADLASVSPGTLRAFGYSHQKERAILELSRAVASG
ncbi:MAG: hypothetical protein WA876_09755, partial [Candidatus Acidiferrales bacterium]